MILDIKTKLFGSQLLKDNFILFFCTTLLNVLQYLFHFIVGRVLGPADYGIFGSLLSIMYIMVVPIWTIQTTITKFVTKYNVKKEYDQMYYFYFKAYKRLAVVSVIAVILFILLVPFIAKFLYITNYTPMYLLSGFLLFALLIPVYRGMLQGLQRFKLLGFTMVTEGLAKLLIGVPLLLYGLAVNGAVLAFVFSYVVTFFVGLYVTRKMISFKEVELERGNIYKYSIPVLIMVLSLTAFYTADVILIKHYFDTMDAGFYAALSLIGKVIFFGSISISQVMFPKVSELYELKGEHKGFLYKSLLMILLFGGGCTLVFFLFPGLIVKLLFGNAFISIVPLVGLFSLMITIFCLVYIYGFYNISLHRYKFIFVLLLFNILQILLIVFYHESLKQIITYMLGLFFVLLLILAFMTWRAE